MANPSNFNKINDMIETPNYPSFHIL